MLKNISKKTPDPKEDEKLTEEVVADIIRRMAEDKDSESGQAINRILGMKSALDSMMGGGMWSVYSEYGDELPADEKAEPVVAPRPKKTKRKNIRKQGLHRPDDI